MANRFFKNITIKRLAGYTALFLSILFVGIVMISQLIIQSFSAGSFIIVGVVFFALTYMVLFIILRIFIVQKINIIYKIIRKTNSIDRQREKSDKSGDLLTEVEKEVEDWSVLQNEEMKSLRSLEKYRRDFLGNVSHELKTPLFNIQGYLMTLSDGGLYDQAINMPYIKKALVNVDRLDTIIEDLTTMSKLESDKMVLKLESFSIHKLLLEVINALQLQADKRNIKLVIKGQGIEEDMVRADREYIRQVLSNLIMNSIRYGVDGGESFIETFLMNKLIMVEVSDNGIGIDEKHLPYLFDRFYRIDESRSRNLGGSGIGLAIVKHILEAHNQTVSVRSTLREGSTFTFMLDRA